MGLGKNLVYRAFKKIRLTCLGDKPEGFSGIVEVDETYLGGQWKNKRKSVKRKEKPSKKGRGTAKQPVLGLLYRRDGIIIAEEVKYRSGILSNSPKLRDQMRRYAQDVVMILSLDRSRLDLETARVIVKAMAEEEELEPIDDPEVQELERLRRERQSKAFAEGREIVFDFRSPPSFWFQINIQLSSAKIAVPENSRCVHRLIVTSNPRRNQIADVRKLISKTELLIGFLSPCYGWASHRCFLEQSDNLIPDRILWGWNFFGPELVARIGRNNLQRLPCRRIEECYGGIVVQPMEDPFQVSLKWPAGQELAAMLESG